MFTAQRWDDPAWGFHRLYDERFWSRAAQGTRDFTYAVLINEKMENAENIVIKFNKKIEDRLGVVPGWGHSGRGTPHDSRRTPT